MDKTSYYVHYWKGEDATDVKLTSSDTTEQKAVGDVYWNNVAQTFNMYTAIIPKDIDGFVIFNGDTWFNADGDATATNTKAYVFEYDNQYHALYE